jgi:hypothetical protein
MIGWSKPQTAEYNGQNYLTSKSMLISGLSMQTDNFSIPSCRSSRIVFILIVYVRGNIFINET